MSSKLPQREIESIKNTCVLLDEDNSGSLSRKAISTVVRSTGCNPTEKQLQDMFSHIDAEEHDVIEFQDFLDYHAEHFYPTPDGERETIEAFQEFDNDHSGLIDVKVLKEILTKLGEEKLSDAECQDIINSAGVDKDGKVDYREIARLMNK